MPIVDSSAFAGVDLPTSRLTEDVWGFTYTLNDFLGSDFNQRGSGVRRWDGAVRRPGGRRDGTRGRRACCALGLGLDGAGGDAAGKIWSTQNSDGVGSMTMR